MKLLRLAREWFHCSVREMLERVESDELTEMLVEMDAFPWGDLRADWRSAHQVAAVASAAGVEAKIEDCLIDFRSADEPCDEAALVAKIKAAFSAMGYQTEKKR